LNGLRLPFAARIQALVIVATGRFTRGRADGGRQRELSNGAPKRPSAGDEHIRRRDHLSDQECSNPVSHERVLPLGEKYATARPGLPLQRYSETRGYVSPLEATYKLKRSSEPNIDLGFRRLTRGINTANT
jgi:hypothetical protein